MMPNHHLDKNEFVALLLIYAAHADYSFSVTEQQYIRSISEEKVYGDMMTLFNSQSDFETLKILLKNKKAYFDNPAERQGIIDIIKKQFENDGDKYRIERTFLTFFDKMTTEL